MSKKLKKVIVLFLLSISTIGGYTQSINKVFMYDELNTIPFNLLVNNDKLNITGIFIDTSNFGIKLFSSIYDKNGLLIDANFYRPLNYEHFVGGWYYGKLSKVNNGFIQAGYAADTGTGKTNLLLFHIDSLGHLMNYYVYNITNRNTDQFFGISVTQSKENYYYVSGSFSNGSVSLPFLLKADSNGTKIWIKYYNEVRLDFNAGASIIEDDSGHIVIAVISETEYNPPIMHLLANKTTILNIDTAGTLLYARLDTSTSFQVGYSLQKANGNNYITCGHEITNRDSLYGYSNRHGCITKWDSLFNKIWSKDFYNTSDLYSKSVLYDVIEMPDGSIIGCGSSGISLDSLYYGLNGWLLKIDKDGNKIWSREYRSFKYASADNHHYLYDVDVLSNGDIVAVGYVSVVGGDVSQQGWLIKVDSNGCLYDSNWCGYSSIEVEFSPPQASQEEIEVLVYPNPASDVINIEIKNATFNLSDKLSIRIFDIQGREVFNRVENYSENIEVEISQFDSGIYFVSINAEDNKLSASAIRAISVSKFVKE